MAATTLMTHGEAPHTPRTRSSGSAARCSTGATCQHSRADSKGRAVADCFVPADAAHNKISETRYDDLLILSNCDCHTVHKNGSSQSDGRHTVRKTQ
jgi:hypothetical protein